MRWGVGGGREGVQGRCTLFLTFKIDDIISTKSSFYFFFIRIRFFFGGGGGGSTFCTLVKMMKKWTNPNETLFVPFPV